MKKSIIYAFGAALYAIKGEILAIPVQKRAALTHKQDLFTAYPYL